MCVHVCVRARARCFGVLNCSIIQQVCVKQAVVFSLFRGFGRPAYLMVIVRLFCRWSREKRNVSQVFSVIFLK